MCGIIKIGEKVPLVGAKNQKIHTTEKLLVSTNSEWQSVRCHGLRSSMTYRQTATQVTRSLNLKVSFLSNRYQFCSSQNKQIKSYKKIFKKTVANQDVIQQIQKKNYN